MSIKFRPFSREPVVYIAIVDAAIFAAIGFGVPISGEQKSLIDALLLAISAAFMRSQVSPTAVPA